MDNNMNKNTGNNISILSTLLIIVLGLFLLYNSSYILDQRQSALVLQFGNPVSNITKAGLQFKVPFIQNVIFFDKRIQSVYYSPEGQNKEVMAMDQKTMKLTAYAKYRIVDPLLFYEKVRNDTFFQNNIIPIIESSIREIVGTYSFIDVLNTKRQEIIKKITESVKAQVESFGVDIIDVRIVRINLPDKSKRAVYDRMRTDREKEAKEIRAQGAEESQKIKAIADRERSVMLADARSNSEILRGDGDGKALNILLNAASDDPEFYGFYKSMSAYKNALTSNNTSIVLSTNSEFLKYLNNN